MVLDKSTTQTRLGGKETTLRGHQAGHRCLGQPEGQAAASRQSSPRGTDIHEPVCRCGPQSHAFGINGAVPKRSPPEEGPPGDGARRAQGRLRISCKRIWWIETEPYAVGVAR